MKKVIYDGVDYLVISKEKIESMVNMHRDNEKRANELLKEELSKPETELQQKSINMFAHQEIKARGFKEAWEELLLHINMPDIIIDSAANSGWLG